MCAQFYTHAPTKLAMCKVYTCIQCTSLSLHAPYITVAYSVSTSHACIMCVAISAVASAPTNFTAEWVDPGMIRLSWNPPTGPEGQYTVGYRIAFDNGSSKWNQNIAAKNTSQWTIKNAHNGTNYRISIVGKSKHLPSDPVSIDFSFGEYCTP